MWSGLIETNPPLAFLLVGALILLICWWYYHYRKEEFLLQLRVIVRELERDEFMVKILQKDARTRVVLESRWTHVEYEAYAKHERLALNTFFRDAKARGGNLTQLTRNYAEERTRHYAPVTFSREHGLLGNRFYSVSGIAFGKNVHGLIDRIKELMFAHQAIQ